MSRTLRLLIAPVLAVLALSGCGGSSSDSSSTPGQRTTTHAATKKRHRAPAKRTVAKLTPPANPPQKRVAVPVLTYHRVVALPAVGELDLIVDPTVFADEMAALKGAGYHPISQTQLFDALYKGASLPARPIIISVDDGYVDDVRAVLPVLQHNHFVATFFVITGRTREPGFLTDDQIRELDRAGMDVEDHTIHHLDLRQMSAVDLKHETAGSRKDLEKIVGHPIYAFAYPAGEYDDTVVQAVKDAGYTFAYTTMGGTTISTASPLTMPRLHIGRDETPSGILSLLNGE